MRDLVRRRVPIDAVGIQAHLQMVRPFNPGVFGDFVRAIRAEGLAVLVTELDVSTKDVFALYALGVLLYAAVAGIANALPLWLSALIVGVALLLVTGVLVGVGVKLLKKGTPPKPEITVNSRVVSRDVTGTPMLPGTAMAEVRPGTTVTGTPAAAHAWISS